jgi:hypothetical protein
MPGSSVDGERTVGSEGRMISSAEIEVHPDYRMFGIADSEDPEDCPPVPEAAGGWVSAGESSVLVETGVDVPARLRLEYWDGDPRGIRADEWETDDTVTLTLPSGSISLNQITIGWVHGVFALPGRGTYRLQVLGRNCELVAHRYHQLFERFDDVHGPAFQEAYDELSGQMQFLARFWPSRP